MNNWNEQDHPRGKGGQFVGKCGETSGLNLTLGDAPQGLTQQQWDEIVHSCWKGASSFRDTSAYTREDLVVHALEDLSERAVKRGSWDWVTPQYAGTVTRGWVARATRAIGSGSLNLASGSVSRERNAANAAQKEITRLEQERGRELSDAERRDILLKHRSKLATRVSIASEIPDTRASASAEDDAFAAADAGDKYHDLVEEIVVNGSVRRDAAAVLWPLLMRTQGIRVKFGHVSSTRRTEIVKEIPTSGAVRDVVGSWERGDDDPRINMVFEVAGVDDPHGRDTAMRYLTTAPSPDDMWVTMLKACDSRGFIKDGTLRRRIVDLLDEYETGNRS